MSNSVFHIPIYKWRDMMFPQLLIQFDVCLLLVLSAEVEVAQANPPIAQPGCLDTCGNVTIPFPFGIGPNCFHDSWFEIECKPSSLDSNASFKPFFSKFQNIQVLDMYIDLQDRYSNYVTVPIPRLNSCAASTQEVSSIDFSGSPYKFSTVNVFMVEGCPGGAVLVAKNNKIAAGCANSCGNISRAIPTNNCYGVQCCQSPLHENLQFYKTDFNNQSTGENENRLVATLIDRSYVDGYVGKLSTSHPSSAVPAVLGWNWMKNDSRPLHSHAIYYPNTDYLSCDCDSKHNYYGNPYVSGGCQVPEACKACRGGCFPNWNSTGAIPDSYSCEKKPIFSLGVILGPSISFGILLLVIGLYRPYLFIKRRREMKRKAKFFKRNGGLLLQQQLSSNEGVVERAKIFSVSELDKATDHFNQNRILGQGGQGTVYKGMLTDGRIVAIKKSKLPDESQSEQFINEVIIYKAYSPQIKHCN